jgi:hypothetical protein
MSRRRRASPEPLDEEEPAALRRRPTPPLRHSFYENDAADGRCVICQCDLEAAEQLFSGPCKHPLHAQCARDYVREWVLNHSREDVQPPCPLCKSDEAFDMALFPVSQEDEEDRARRAEATKNSQEAEDMAMARNMFLEEFGINLVHRRGAWRRLDLEMYTFIARASREL